MLSRVVVVVFFGYSELYFGKFRMTLVWICGHMLEEAAQM